MQIIQDLWYRKILEIIDTKRQNVEILEVLARGFLVKTSSNIVGLLNVKYNRNELAKIKLGDKVDVILSTVDLLKKRVNFKLN